MHILNHLSWSSGTGFPFKTDWAQIYTHMQVFSFFQCQREANLTSSGPPLFPLLSSVSVVTRIQGSKFGINKRVLRKLVTHGAVHMTPLIFL